MATSHTTRGCIRHPSIMVNCAYARVAFRELSKQEPDQRVTQFKQLFCEYPGFHLSDSYFQRCCGKRNPSQFERDHTQMNKAFSSKWHPSAARSQYECQFSITKWKALPSAIKQKHSLKLALFNFYNTRSFFLSNLCLSLNRCFTSTHMTSRA